MKLVAATGEQQRARDRQAHAAWGAQLTVDGYVEREARLRSHPWARQAMTTWLLLGDDGGIRSSCETYRMDGWCRGARGDVWAVASVFTEEALRGHGHATAMLDRLLERARPAGVLASILYSDVGARQYERSGYRARPAEDLLFTPAAGDPADGVDALVADGQASEARAASAASGARAGGARPVAGACDSARPSASRDSASRPPADGAGAAVASPAPDPTGDELVVWPTEEQLDWHVERTRSYAALLGRPALPWVGARVGRGHIRWMVDWKSASLKILLLATDDAAEATALVQAARRMAAVLTLAEIRLWAQPWPFDVDRTLGGQRIARPDSLPMLASLDPSLSADDWRQIPRAIWV